MTIYLMVVGMQGGLESTVIFNIYMDFVLRCAEFDVLKTFSNTGLNYTYRIKSESTTREQRSIHKMYSSERLRMLLYADDIVLFCEDIVELESILQIHYETLWTYYSVRQNQNHCIQRQRECNGERNTNLLKRSSN